MCNFSSCVVCQRNGQLRSDRAERYEMDDASDSGESDESTSGAAVNKNISELSLDINEFIKATYLTDAVHHKTGDGRGLLINSDKEYTVPINMDHKPWIINLGPEHQELVLPAVI